MGALFSVDADVRTLNSFESDDSYFNKYVKRYEKNMKKTKCFRQMGTNDYEGLIFSSEIMYNK